jgi:hypothetical protein
MFEDLLLFGIVIAGNLFTWFILRNLKWKQNSVGLIILKVVSFIGIVIHEVAHFLMCLLTGIPPTGIRTSYRDQEGEVMIHDLSHLSFIQGFLICFAPLFISSYIAYLCIHVMFLTSAVFFIKVIAGVVFISILLHARPSISDLKVFRSTFTDDPLYSMYQIALIVLSGLIVFFMNLPLPYYLSFVHYIVIGIFYMVFKYGLLGLRRGYGFLATKFGGLSVQRAPTNPYRKQHKPTQTKREQVPRRQW